MKYLIILVLAAGLFGCTKTSTVGCTIETTVSTALSSTIAGALTCTNQAQINTDLLAALGKANLCTSTTTMLVSPKGVIAGIACPVAVNAVLGLITTSIPKAWGCSPTATTASLSAALTAACMALPI